jgi:hypothetical protein
MYTLKEITSHEFINLKNFIKNHICPADNIIIGLPRNNNIIMDISIVISVITMNIINIQINKNCDIFEINSNLSNDKLQNLKDYIINNLVDIKHDKKIIIKL